MDFDFREPRKSAPRCGLKPLGPFREQPFNCQHSVNIVFHSSPTCHGINYQASMMLSMASSYSELIGTSRASLSSRQEDNSMQDPYAVTFERRQLFIDQNATQMLQHILPNCLPSLYGRAFRGSSQRSRRRGRSARRASCCIYPHGPVQGQVTHVHLADYDRHNCACMQLRKRARRVHLPLEEQNAEVYELSLSERLADPRPGPEEECRQSELSRRLYHWQTQLSPTLRPSISTARR